MDYMQNVESLEGRIEALVGKGRVAQIDLNEEGEEGVCVALGELADSERGGAILALGDEDMLDEDGDSLLSHLASLFPILEINISEVEEGPVWVALVAGTGGVPEGCGDAAAFTRVAELTVLNDAELSELDLSALFGSKVDIETIDTGHVLEAVLSDDDCVWDKGLVTIRDGVLVPTVAGMVALGRHPYRHLPGMCVELNLYGQRICWRGSLRELEALANELTIPCLLPGKKKFRELLMNALLHRSWRQNAWRTPVHVIVADGQLEITHPGLLGSWRVGKSTPMNPRLYALASHLNVAKGKGAGLQMMESYLIKQQFRPLELRERDGGVQLEVTWPFPAEGKAPQPESARRASEVTPVAQSIAAPRSDSIARVRDYEQAGSRSSRPLEYTTPVPSRDAYSRESFEEHPRGVAPSGHGLAGRIEGDTQARGVQDASVAFRQDSRVWSTENARPLVHQTEAPHSLYAQVARAESRDGVAGLRSSGETRPTEQREPHLKSGPGASSSMSSREAATSSTNYPASRAGVDNRPTQIATATRPVASSTGATRSAVPVGQTREAPSTKGGSKPVVSSSAAQDDKERVVVQQLKQRGPMTTQELMQALNWTRWATRTAFERLMEAGTVHAAAASARSPLQTYEIV